jgi:hypothetical protein
MGMGVAHRADDRESITGIGHVQIGEENIEIFRRNESQGFVHGRGGHYLKTAVFQAFLKHGTKVVIVVD